EPVPRESELALHVLEAVDHDEEADPSNYVGQKHAERINKNTSVHAENRRGDPCDLVVALRDCKSRERRKYGRNEGERYSSIISKTWMDLRKGRRENSPCERCSPNQPWNERQFISCSNDSLTDGGESADNGSWIDSKDHCNNAQNNEWNSDCPGRFLDICRVSV